MAESVCSSGSVDTHTAAKIDVNLFSTVGELICAKSKTALNLKETYGQRVIK